MAFAKTLIQSQGPLPLKVTFQAPADGPVFFMLSGSAWTTNAPTMLKVFLQLDGTTIGTASVYANQSSIHQALVSIVAPANLTDGQHAIAVVATGNTVTDLNDNFQVTLIY